MNSLGLAVFFVALVAANASGILGHGGIIVGHAGTVTGLGSPAVLAGPSGTVVRSGIAATGPAVVAGHGIGGVGVLGNAGVLGVNGLGVGGLGLGGLGLGGLGIGALGGHGLVVPAGSGLEGQWIPDINEKLHDDGSYKPHIYGH